MEPMTKNDNWPSDLLMESKVPPEFRFLHTKDSVEHLQEMIASSASQVDTVTEDETDVKTIDIGNEVSVPTASSGRTRLQDILSVTICAFKLRYYVGMTLTLRKVKWSLLLLALLGLCSYTSSVFHTRFYNSDALPLCANTDKLASIAQTQAMAVSNLYHVATETCGLADRFVTLSGSAKELDSKVSKAALLQLGGQSQSLSRRAKTIAHRLSTLCTDEIDAGSRIRHWFDGVLDILAHINDMATNHGLETASRTYTEALRVALQGAPRDFSGDLDTLRTTVALVLRDVTTLDALANATEDALRADAQATPGTWAWPWAQTNDSTPVESTPSLSATHAAPLDSLRLASEDTRRVVERSASLLDALLAQMWPQKPFPVVDLFVDAAALNQLIVTLRWYKANMDHDAKQSGSILTGKP